MFNHPRYVVLIARNGYLVLARNSECGANTVSGRNTDDVAPCSGGGALGYGDAHSSRRSPDKTVGILPSGLQAPLTHTRVWLLLSKCVAAILQFYRREQKAGTKKRYHSSTTQEKLRKAFFPDYYPTARSPYNAGRQAGRHCFASHSRRILSPSPL